MQFLVSTNYINDTTTTQNDSGVNGNTVSNRICLLQVIISSATLIAWAL